MNLKMIHERLPRKVFWSCGQLQNLCPDIPCSSWLVIELKNYHTGAADMVNSSCRLISGFWHEIGTTKQGEDDSPLPIHLKTISQVLSLLPIDLIKEEAFISLCWGWMLLSWEKKKKKQHHVSIMSQRSRKESNRSKNPAVNMWGRKANNIKYEASCARRKDSAANQAAACNFWSC